MNENELLMDKMQQSNKFVNFILYVLIVTTSMGSILYIKFASFYHFLIMAVLLFILLKGINTMAFKNSSVYFFGFWLLESLVSILWAPDKNLALQYIYYIFLIFSTCLIFSNYISKKNFWDIAEFMVLLLLISNIIAIWEIVTGNHLVADYLSTANRIRNFEFVPGVFFYNPNDCATFIILLLPFSLTFLSSSKTIIRICSYANLILSLFTIFSTSSRTQIILVFLMYIFFVVVAKKTKILKILIFIIPIVFLIIFLYPDLKQLIKTSFDSITTDSIKSSSQEGNSLGIRFALLKNGFYILMDSFGFGVGAGCHRVIMPQYSSLYYSTGHVTVMHNLVAEIFVDYGLAVGIFFFVFILTSIKNLINIFKSHDVYNIKILSMLFVYSLSVFIICTISSSSILQLTSLWIPVFMISVFIKIYDYK